MSDELGRVGTHHSSLITRHSVGIVVVSHSARLAEGVVELAREMAGADVRIAAAGGLDLPDQPLGTDAALIRGAIEQVYSAAGVVVLLDLGSALLSAELAVELLPEEWRPRIRLADAPLVEGAVAAAVEARLGGSLEQVAAAARVALAPKIAHLAQPAASPPAEPDTAEQPGHALRLIVGNPLGLHARPAARLVEAVSRFRARVEVRDLTAGTGPASGRSLTALATLGVRSGHEILVAAAGDDAEAALAAVAALARANFGDPAVGPPAARPGPARRAGARSSRSFRGIPAAPGVAIGVARPLRLVQLPVADVPTDDPEVEWATLDRALAVTREELRRERERAAREVGDDAAAIFAAHLLLLEDEALLDPARRGIFRERQGAAAAWSRAADQIADRFRALDDAYLRERAGDVGELRRRVLANLPGGMRAAAPVEPGIAILRDLDAAVVASCDPNLVRGVCAAAGGPTSHGAILARGLGIPTVVGLGDEILAVPEGTTLVVDGGAGIVWPSPGARLLQRYREKAEVERAEREAARAGAARPAMTRAGKRVPVLANVGSAADARAAAASGADGIGLLRTEYLFLDRAEAPGEEEQVAAYREIARIMAGRPVVIRTLDAGGDKPLPYLHPGGEGNPFLGCRAIRLSLAHPDVFKVQLRAIARVAADCPVRVMFPMVATLEEWRAARRLLHEAMAEVARRGVTIPAEIPTGMMVEVPAAALAAASFAEEVDFFSIGTNDLAQYTFAADRGNAAVAALADPFQPALLRLVREVAEAARARGKTVAVCGEMAGDPRAVPLLLELGVDELSVNPVAIPAIKEAVRAV